MLLSWQGLRETVSRYVSSRDLLNRNRAFLNLLAKPMLVDIYVTKLRVQLGSVLGKQLNRLLVVAANCMLLIRVELHSFKEALPPN